MVAEYLIVSINEDDEHEIIFVSKDMAETARRYLAIGGDCYMYTLLNDKIELMDAYCELLDKYNLCLIENENLCKLNAEK